VRSEDEGQGEGIRKQGEERKEAKAATPPGAAK